MIQTAPFLLLARRVSLQNKIHVVYEDCSFSIGTTDCGTTETQCLQLTSEYNVASVVECNATLVQRRTRIEKMERAKIPLFNMLRLKQLLAGGGASDSCSPSKLNLPHKKSGVQGIASIKLNKKKAGINNILL